MSAGPKKTAPTNITNFKDLLDDHSDSLIAGVNCISIGTITVFDPTNQTVQGTINYRKWDGQNWIEYPAIMDAPAVILTGGSAQLTFPIQKGDTCIFLFNDRPISSWFVSGQVGPLPSFRMHSFADGMALVGVRSLLNCIKTGDPGFAGGYDMLHALLAWGTTQIGVSATKVRAANAFTTLGSVLAANVADPKAPLGGLMTALQTFCTACSGSTDATLVAAAAALNLSLSTPVTGIAALTKGLLE